METPQKRKRDSTDDVDTTSKKLKAADPKEGDVKQPSSKSTVFPVIPKDSNATTTVKASPSVLIPSALKEDDMVTYVIPYTGETITRKRIVSAVTRPRTWSR